ncbi:MAG: glycosyltransferase [Caldilineaceae bacterium]|nr:glycosyltransferase [Caldilineaceae bacterium]MCB0096129.1 glycosyltransferase [Caldilineaceae bacterium]MCB9149845.1 glycosyltransferase [Caldilineaceae bacterium]
MSNSPAPSVPAQPFDIDVSIVLPTYNERDNICDLIDEISQKLEPTELAYEVLVMDDSSPDGTATAVRDRYNLSADAAGGPISPKGVVRLHVRTHDRGLAKSIRDGLERAHGRTLVVMDTDFNHDPAMIPQMVDLLRYYDLIIGSRFVMGGGMEDTMRYRASLLYNVFIRFLFHTQIQDNLSGFFAIRRERLFELEAKFDRIFYGYGDYFIRLLLLAWRANWKILEAPVFYILRRHGDSKTGFWKIFRDYTAAVLKLRLFGL